MADLPKKTLEFPAYVPEKVRTYAKSILLGDIDDSADGGWLGLLLQRQAELTDVESRIRENTDASESVLSPLRRERFGLTEEIKRITADVGCLERLTSHTDIDMENAYALLKSHLAGEKQVWTFIYSAVSAHIEFTVYREALKSSLEIKKKIAKSSLDLAELLDMFERTGVHAPDEFFSVRELILKTVNSPNEAEPLRQTRHPVISLDGIDNDDYEDIADNEFEVIALDETEALASASHDQNLGFAWNSEPPLPTLLRTLAESALIFTPQENAFIGTALSSRKHNKKNMYIRAFAHLLQENGIPLNAQLEGVMATVASISLNDPEIIVTHDDVRKSIP